MFKVTIRTSGAAFEENEPNFEIARLLQEIARRLVFTFEDCGPILDANGNTVGSWEYTEND